MQPSDKIENLLTENRSFKPSKKLRESARISSKEEYAALWKASIENPSAFWLKQAERLDWFLKPTYGLSYTWNTERKIIEHSWFADGALNASYNCLDRHIAAGKGSKEAIIWQGDEESAVRRYTYQQLYEEVCKCSHALSLLGIKKGDRVAIYLPMVPELAITMLACARIGAIHSVIFAGFSAESIVSRINDAQCRLLITGNEAQRGGKRIPLKEIADAALVRTVSVEHAVVVRVTDTACAMTTGRDLWYHELLKGAETDCDPARMLAEDALFVLYTSGSTDTPKGIVHTTGGYLVQTSLTHELAFNVHDDDIYWCTADIGWITGHSYIVYGPLANGATVLMFEGIPTYPDPGRFWRVCDQHGVTIFYTAPTAIRALMRFGKQWPAQYLLDSLRVLGTVGEPINPEAWMWYYTHIGRQKCPIVDTWWQTETGAFMLAPLPGVHTLKPGSVSRPFFGVDPVVLREDGSECGTNEGGSLCIRTPWPSMARTMWGDHERFVDAYFSRFKDVYYTGDGCRVDGDGDYWILGRLDDVVNVSGNRIGTAEVESALVSHNAVVEAAVVPIHHEIKGQGLYAFVTIQENVQESPELRDELIHHVASTIGPIAKPEYIQWAAALPKTRSGKIMRRILRKIAAGETKDLGDITTLADIHVVEALIAGREYVTNY